MDLIVDINIFCKISKTFNSVLFPWINASPLQIYILCSHKYTCIISLFAMMIFYFTVNNKVYAHAGRLTKTDSCCESPTHCDRKFDHHTPSDWLRHVAICFNWVHKKMRLLLNNNNTLRQRHFADFHSPVQLQSRLFTLARFCSSGSIFLVQTIHAC